MGILVHNRVCMRWLRVPLVQPGPKVGLWCGGGTYLYPTLCERISDG